MSHLNLQKWSGFIVLGALILVIFGAIESDGEPMRYLIAIFLVALACWLSLMDIHSHVGGKGKLVK